MQYNIINKFWEVTTMKKFNFFDFMGGKEVTIREVLEKEESPKENLTYFVLSLYQTDEKAKINIETKNAKLIKPNVTLFYAVKSEDVKGYTLWKKGLGPFGIKLPQECLDLDPKM